MKKLFATALLLFTVFSFSSAQQLTLNTAFPETDGTIYSSCIDSAKNILYIAGLFNSVGTEYRYGMKSDTNRTVPAFWPETDGQINTSCPDGAGGYFIGGWFTTVDGKPHKGLARIAGNGTVYSWAPQLDNYYIDAVALRHDTLAISGSFETVGGQARHRFALVNANTGAVLNTTYNNLGGVYSFHFLGRYLFIGGGNTTSGNIPKYRSFVALNLLTGKIDSSFGFVSTQNSVVTSIASSGNKLFLGGSFTVVNGSTNTYYSVAAIDLTTKNFISWNPNIPSSQRFYVNVKGNNLYVGGDFKTVNGFTRNNFCSFNVNSLALTNWAPQFPSMVSSFTFVGKRIVGMGRTIVLVDTSSGSIKDLKLTGAGGAGSNNYATVSSDGTHFFVGGNFTAIGGVARSNVAAIDLTTNTVTGWNPAVEGIPSISGSYPNVNAIVKQGNIIYIGGRFALVNGQRRDALAAINENGQLQPWAPNVGITKYIGEVYAFCKIGNRLYIGGQFDSINKLPRTNLGGFDLTTGNLLSWAPSVNSTVKCLANTSQSLFIGGYFNNYAGQLRKGLAVVSLSSLTLNSWVPVLDTFAVVNNLAVIQNRLFIGGDYNSVDGKPRQGIADVDLSTRVVSSLGVTMKSFYGVTSIVELKNILYVGGDFYEVNGINPRRGLISFDMATNTLLPWDPKKNVSGTQNTHLVAYKDKLIFFGKYDQLDATPVTNSALFELKDVIVSGLNTVYCTGSTFPVNYSSSATFSGGNVFTVQLSDANGSFTSPVNIGTLNSSGSTGNISVTIPPAQPKGNKYRMRIVSSNPVLTGSISSTFFISAGGPSKPTAISGPVTGLCPAGLNSAVYSISSVPTALSYTWAVPAGTNITSGQGTKSVNVSFGAGFTQGYITVNATNICGTSAKSTLILKSTASVPAPVTGLTSVCKGSTQVYSVAPVTGASSYVWKVPAGTVINSGQGTTSINVKMGANSGSVTVKSSNACGLSAKRSLAVNVTCRNEELEMGVGDGLSVYPNPATNLLTVTGMELKEGNIEVKNVLGQAVSAEILAIRTNAVDLDVSLLSPGVYFVVVNTSSGKTVAKFVKE